ncbi:hypothetical protein BTO06_01030 [Tenacibaculum sp. SZ-18]|uniref:hypothetical protein n=1 Tax=Tenacibaculum sp. SZ-18 TaxID=754423 RepID=UPI000C2D6531|nr:hypothetical protein [Tenacibaculum sp. SZ-18]AUC13817.1 hypothetical protein BTO06_01030 [Tenacibaculum sp. SZ-18]
MITEKEAKRKIKVVKERLCQKLIDGETTIEILESAKKELISENESENFYQVEAIQQAIEWYNKLN